jgi:tRNA threonylcarbamoyladenosine biosynthesis protein TsaB
MALILCIETSTTVCSVSVSGDGKLLSLREITDAKSHASQLTPFITEVLAESGAKPQNLSAIAVSKGPGSYTGLRIGVSTAKGMAFALKIPLVSVGTLLSMTTGFLDKNPDFSGNSSILFCPMIDARRMEVYSALFDAQLKEFRKIQAEIIHEDSFLHLFKNYKIHFFGDGAMKCSSLMNNKSAIFHENFHPSAKFMGKLAEKQFKEGKFEDLAYFEPFYLKDFVATIPSDKLL